MSVLLLMSSADKRTSLIDLSTNIGSLAWTPATGSATWFACVGMRVSRVKHGTFAVSFASCVCVCVCVRICLFSGRVVCCECVRARCMRVLVMPRDGVRQFSAAIQNGVSLVDVSSSCVNGALLAAAPKSLPTIGSALRQHCGAGIVSLLTCWIWM